jgi:beta-N-acetylhexosaminidase
MPADQFFSLPFEQQIGQFFFIGLPGTDIDQETRELLNEIKPGGIILFGRNVESPQQVRQLLDDCRTMLPTLPLCGIDQEGGLVDRLRGVFTPMPSARALRQHGDLAGVRTLGKITGELLRMLGFDINFAPVMSIITQERSQLTNGL